MPLQDKGIKADIVQYAVEEHDPAGREIRVIGEAEVLSIADRHDRTPRQIHQAAMEMEVWPRRYIRNHDTLSLSDQLKLLKARIAVIGAGGLGGYTLQFLARIGIGTLVAVDHDVFDESNLNRQAFARTDTIGSRKTDIVADEIVRINPGIDLIAFPVRIIDDNIDDILQGCAVAVDALDNTGDRIILGNSCARLKIPLVHGALTGFEGRMMTIFPSDAELLHESGGPASGPSAESLMGIPSIAPAFIATLQAMEAIKIVLNRGRLFRNRMLYADLENGNFEEFRMV